VGDRLPLPRPQAVGIKSLLSRAFALGGGRDREAGRRLP
jgi:hypothetical protein